MFGFWKDEVAQKRRKQKTKCEKREEKRVFGLDEEDFGIRLSELAIRSGFRQMGFRINS